MSNLDKVRELHNSVRDWIERSAVAQKNGDLRANFPYVDLMFAFGVATLGDHATAHTLTEDARKVLEVPVPEGDSPREEQALTAAVVRNFLLRAFRYRIEQALRGEPHGGPLSAEVSAARDEIGKKGGSGPVNNPYKLATFVIERLREFSRIVEPTERVDQYAEWTNRGDALVRQLAELRTIRDPAALTERVRSLYRDGLQGPSLLEVQFRVLHESLPLAPRVGEKFAMELLALVAAALRSGMSANVRTDLPIRERELLASALVLAGHFRRTEIVQQLVDVLSELVRSRPEGARYGLVNAVMRSCIQSLKRVGPMAEVDRFLTQLHGEVLGGESAIDLQKRHSATPEVWAAVLQSLLNFAGGWQGLGLHDRAAPILAEARSELLSTRAGRPYPKDYTELARAYVTALGDGVPEPGLTGMVELFRMMDPQKITNTWTTAQYYSRFHLNLVEDTVLGVIQLCSADPAPTVVSA